MNGIAHLSRRRRVGATALLGVMLGALLSAPAGAAPFRPSTPADGRNAHAPQPVADGNSSLMMVLDSSGSMADDDGSGSTRIEAARKAVGTVVDRLPDGHPTGLRVYGADKTDGCQDTRLVKPVGPLDRAGLKQAVAGLRPKGDTPIGLSLRKAAEDLPETPDDALGRRTILLISDGEDTCGSPDPCEVAEELGRQGIDLRVDAIGFQVAGSAREELRCIAEAGHGSYYDAPDADALARQLQRAAQLSAGAFRFRGDRITGGDRAEQAAALRPGQYLDSIGPGETRWYSAELDAESAADFSATAVPQPGVPVGSLDGLKTELTSTGEIKATCGTARATFGQDEGAFPLTVATGRIPSPDGGNSCDKAGTYLFSVTRDSEDEKADRARWPLEIRYGVEKPLPGSVTPAQSEPEYGEGGKDAELPTGTPKDTTGGTGFNDATELRRGVWRDTILPAQTRWYRVPVGWGQQLRYDVEIANEPTLKGSSPTFSFIRTDVYSPSRYPLGNQGEFRRNALYTGEPTAVSLGTVPVAWSNRHELQPTVAPVRRDGAYYIAVTLGADTQEIAANAAVGLVLRVDVKGRKLSGPEHGAPPADGKAPDDPAGADGAGGAQGGADRQQAAGNGGEDEGGGPGRLIVAAVSGGTGVALLAWLASAYARGRRRAPKTPQGGAW